MKKLLFIILCLCFTTALFSEEKTAIILSGGFGFPPLKKYYLEIISNYENQNPKIKIVLNELNYEKIVRQSEIDHNKVVGDVYIIDKVFLDYLKDDFLEISQIDKSFKKENYYKVVLDALTYQEEVMAFPYSYTPRIIFINTDVLKLKNVSLPQANWNWNDFVEYAKRLTFQNGDKKTWGYLCQYYMFSEWTDWYIQAGTKFDKYWFYPQKHLTEAVKALKFTTDLAFVYGVSPSMTPLMDDYLNKDGVPDPDIWLTRGDFAMNKSLAWTSIYYDMLNFTNYYMVECPVGDKKGCEIVISGIAIKKDTKALKESIAFAKYLHERPYTGAPALKDPKYFDMFSKYHKKDAQNIKVYLSAISNAVPQTLPDYEAMKDYKFRCGAYKLTHSEWTSEKEDLFKTYMDLAKKLVK